MKENLDKIARDDGRYNPNAVKFVYEGLGYTMNTPSRNPAMSAGRTFARHCGNWL